MKKMLYTLITILIGFVLLCGCDPQKPQDEIVKLNIDREGAVKFEYLPTDWPPTNGGETTDQDLIYEIIDQLNEHEYHIKLIEGAIDGCGAKDIRITYENGNKVEFAEAGVDIIKSDGTWLRRTDGEFDLQNYLVKKLNFKLKPDLTRLNIIEEGAECLSYTSARLPDDVELRDREEIQHILMYLNSDDYYICTNAYRTEFPEPSGYLVIRYADGTVIKYADAENFMQRPDGVWLEHANGQHHLSTILANTFGISYDIIYGTN